MIASVYQPATQGRTVRTGSGIGVSCRTATTTVTRTLMMRKRTRPSHGSQSLTLGVNSISGAPLDLNPHPGRVPRQAIRLATGGRFGRLGAHIHAHRIDRYQCPDNLLINENNGKYIEMTTPPTTTPRKTIMIGSIAVRRSFTAASTSSS